MPAPHRLDVSIETADGVILAGWLYLPDGDTPVPGVVMNHGFSATRHMGLPGFAEAFASAGMAVLLYDHRNLGDSGGEPRQEIDPWAQMLDARTALTWLGARPEVDADRLGLWGSSFSGGEAICLAAVDRRIKAVVANAPFAGLGDLDAGDLDATAPRFEGIAAVLEGRTPPPRIPPWGRCRWCASRGRRCPGSWISPRAPSGSWATAVTARRWANTVTVRFSAEPSFDPAACVARVSPTPLLMVVAREDRVADAAVALATFEAAREPKQLELVDGHHFADYQGPGFDKAAATTAAFFARHL